MTAFQALITTGTPDTGWVAAAQAWLRAVCPHDLALEPFSRWVQAQHGAMPAAVPGFGRAGAPVWGGLDAAAAPLLPALGQRFPRVHALLFLQSPEECLALSFTAGEAADASAVLARWQAAAEAMLDHVQRHHDRSLMIDVAEWRALPDAAGARIAGFLGLPAPAHWPPPPPAPDPLPLALAGALTADLADLKRLHSQCLAACIPLAPDTAPALRTAFGVSEYAQAAAQWRSTLERGARAEAELAEARTHATQAATAHDAAVAELQQALEAQARAHREEAEALRQALAAARQSLAAQQAERTTIGAEFQRAQQAQSALQSAHDALRAEHDTVVNSLLALQERWLQAQSQVAQLQAEQRTMLRHLHEQQDQVDRAARERSRIAALASPLRADHLVVQALEIGAERDQPPHRELGVVLLDVQAPDRRLARVACRLVEHHGRAGLALLHAPGAEPPMRAWTPSGQEEGRDFVLLIPEDDDGRRRLEALGTGDCLFVEALVSHIEVALADDRVHGPRWRPVVQQLRELLWRQRPRWRYDRLDVRAVDGGHLLGFREVLCGGFRARRVELMWRPGGRGAAALMRPSDAADPPLLVAWPRGDDGQSLASFVLPLDDATPASERLARWRALPRADRELLLAMLQALAGMASGQPPPDGVDAGAWQALPGLLKAALRLQYGGRLRRTVDAARGRIVSAR